MSIHLLREARHPIVFTLSVLLLLALLLAACRPGTPNPGTPSPGPLEETDSPSTESALPTASRTAPPPTHTPQPSSQLGLEPSDLEGTEIELWHIWPGEAGRVLADLTEEFNVSNPWGIQAQASYQGNYDELFESVRAAQEDGGLPDLVTSYLYQAQTWEMDGSSPQAGEAQGTSQSAGTPGEMLAELDTYVDDPVWGFSPEEQADFYPAYWEQDVVGGHRLGIPAQRSAQFLYYNLSWAQELGFEEPPATPEQLRRQACAAAEANRQDDNPDNDLTGGWIISTHYSAISAWIHAFGGEIVQDNAGGSGSGYRFDTPEAEEALHFLRDLHDQGCAWLAEVEPTETEFAGRLGLFSTGSAVSIPRQAAAFQRAENDDEWTVLPYPGPEEVPAISAYGPSFVILKSEPERQLAAWLFLKWLASPESQARLAQVSGYFPVRRSAQDLLNETGELGPQWAAALDLVQYAHPEPVFRSWSTVRWAVSDAATQLFRYYFTIDQVPDLVKLLDDTAADLHGEER